MYAPLPEYFISNLIGKIGLTNGTLIRPIKKIATTGTVFNHPILGFSANWVIETAPPANKTV
jgi:hypothetical protein